GPHVVGGRSRSERVERLRIAEAEVGGRLARTEEWAGKHGLGYEAVGAELLAELARLVVSLGRERAQLVGISRRGFSVADEHEPHRIGAVGYLCGFPALRRCRRLHRQTADRQSTGRLHGRARRGRRDDAEAREGDELLRDGLRPAWR